MTSRRRFFVNSIGLASAGALTARSTAANDKVVLGFMGLGGRGRHYTAASTNEIGRFETDTLTTRENLNRLMDVSGQWLDHVQRHRKLTRIVLDMDSSVSETCGQQQAHPTTATSAAPATIPCSCSTSPATWSG